MRVDKFIFLFKFDFIHNVYSNNAEIQLLGAITKKKK